MKRSLVRDAVGTGLMFLFLVLFTAFLIFGENALEAFKSH